MSRILYVVSNTTTPTASETNLQSLLIEKGHIVTQLLYSAAVPASLTTDHDLVLQSPSVPDQGTKWDNVIIGVGSTQQNRRPHTEYYNGTVSGGATSATSYMLGTAPSQIASPITAPSTYALYSSTSTNNIGYMRNTILAPSVIQIAAVRDDLQDRVHISVCEAGATLLSATATPSRRGMFMLSWSDADYVKMTQVTKDLFNRWLTYLAIRPPVADAGLDQAVNQAVIVNLDGTGSTDSDGTITSYAWTQTAGTTVALNDTSSATPSFTSPSSPLGDTLTFSLTVTDDGAESAADTVTITVIGGTSRNVAVGGVWTEVPHRHARSGSWTS